MSRYLKLTHAVANELPLFVATDGSVRGHHLGCGYLSDAGGWGVYTWPLPPGRPATHAPLHAELHAIERAERRYKHHVTFLSDCQPAVDLVQAWLAGDLRPIPGYTGASLVKFARRLPERACPLRIEWVRGHAGHPLNEGADTLARLGSRTVPDKLDSAEVRRRAAGIAEAFARAAAA